MCVPLLKRISIVTSWLRGQRVSSQQGMLPNEYLVLQGGEELYAVLNSAHIWAVVHAIFQWHPECATIIQLKPLDSWEHRFCAKVSRTHLKHRS